ncbi:hypothetical protein G5S35_06865 [Paraburkholderia tropica]|uniref:hypothetical protein n=1 Tax=Paraburkholderia tropica TaxID=92647 RepID=UPI00160404EE|nr:hypothetical protein [Paraburkholderia tropica]QNB11321.1 hypothetical protein G5S35_06865 [Paraburkholderia tropica]
MSYDLMVFEATRAPVEPEAFMAWYREQTQWTEDHGYNDPAISSDALRNWMMDMIQMFHAMNGPLAPEVDPEDEALLTDYCMGRDVIYVAFAWSKAELAYATMFDLAARHRVGFFNVSSGVDETWLPEGEGKLKQL